MTVIKAQHRFARHIGFDPADKKDTMVVALQCPACNSFRFHIIVEISEETPTLKCANRICGYEVGPFEFLSE